MFALYMFGARSNVWSAALFRLLFRLRRFGGGLTADVAAVIGGVYPTVGASGGVFGLLLAYGMYFPNNRVMLLFPPIPMPARVFVVVYAAIELFLGVTGSQAGVAHFAHLGGMIGGFIMFRYWRGFRARRL